MRLINNAMTAGCQTIQDPVCDNTTNNTGIEGHGDRSERDKLKSAATTVRWKIIWSVGRSIHLENGEGIAFRRGRRTGSVDRLPVRGQIGTVKYGDRNRLVCGVRGCEARLLSFGYPARIFSQKISSSLDGVRPGRQPVVLHDHLVLSKSFEQRQSIRESRLMESLDQFSGPQRICHAAAQEEGEAKAN